MKTLGGEIPAMASSLYNETTILILAMVSSSLTCNRLETIFLDQEGD